MEHMELENLGFNSVLGSYRFHQSSILGLVDSMSKDLTNPSPKHMRNLKLPMRMQVYNLCIIYVC